MAPIDFINDQNICYAQSYLTLHLRVKNQNTHQNNT